MRHLLATMVICFLLLASNVFAADVTLNIVIPDAYVSRAAAAFEAQYKCSSKGLNPKQCAEKMIRDKIKAIVKAYEKKEASKAAEGTVTNIEVN